MREKSQKCTFFPGLSQVWIAISGICETEPAIPLLSGDSHQKNARKPSLTLLISGKVFHDSSAPVLALCFLKLDTVCATDLKLATLGMTDGELVVGSYAFCSTLRSSGIPVESIMEFAMSGPPE